MVCVNWLVGRSPTIQASGHTCLPLALASGVRGVICRPEDFFSQTQQPPAGETQAEEAGQVSVFLAHRGDEPIDFRVELRWAPCQSKLVDAGQVVLKKRRLETEQQPGQGQAAPMQASPEHLPLESLGRAAERLQKASRKGTGHNVGSGFTRSPNQAQVPEAWQGRYFRLSDQTVRSRCGPRTRDTCGQSAGCATRTTSRRLSRHSFGMGAGPRK